MPWITLNVCNLAVEVEVSKSIDTNYPTLEDIRDVKIQSGIGEDVLENTIT